MCYLERCSSLWYSYSDSSVKKEILQSHTLPQKISPLHTYHFNWLQQCHWTFCWSCTIKWQELEFDCDVVFSSFSFQNQWINVVLKRNTNISCLKLGCFGVFFPQSPVWGKFLFLISEFWTSTLSSDLTMETPARHGERGSASAFIDVAQTKPTGANTNAFFSNRWCLPKAPSTQRIIYHRFQAYSTEKKRLHLCLRTHGTPSLFQSDALRVWDCECFTFNPLISSC